MNFIRNHIPDSSEIKIEELGHFVDSSLASRIKHRIHAIMKSGNRHVDIFPGMQPVSFDQFKIRHLMENDYYVCEKSDGIRILGFIVVKKGLNGQRICSLFLTDRKYEFREVLHVGFPFDPKGERFHHETLVDGELVLDHENGNKVLRLYIFDLVAINSESVMDLDLNERFSMMLKKLIYPWNEFYNKNPGIYAQLPFAVRMKEMFKCYNIGHLLNTIVPGLAHENDGLIFTPVNDPYVVGTNNKLFKWKPENLNTVDFRIAIHRDSRGVPQYQLRLDSSKGSREIDWMVVDENLSRLWQENPPHDQIVECVYDPNCQHAFYVDTKTMVPVEKQGGWVFVRVRRDKRTSNDFNVYKKMIASMDYGVGREELMGLGDEIKRRWKERERLRKA